MATQRAGMTLIESLVVLGLIGVLLAILIPAVQNTREAGRRMTCQNNLRQVTLAVLSHESAKYALPDLYNGTFLKQPRTPFDEFHFHSWRTAILPELEESGLYDRINLSLPATDAANQSVVNTDIATLVCPSASNERDVVPEIMDYNGGKPPQQIVGTAARSDYEVIGGICFRRPSGTVDLQNVKFGAWGEPKSYLSAPTFIDYRKARLRDISDGQAKTLLVAERAGRPDLYVRGKRADPYPYTDPTSAMDHHQAAWAISTHFWWLVFWHEQRINDTNATGIFSFHNAGANVGLADGSVRFLSETIDQTTLNSMATRSTGDAVSLD